LTTFRNRGSEKLGREQKVKDVFAVALLLFFLIVTLAGLYMLNHGNRSTLATALSAVGITGGVLSLAVAVSLILSGDEG
jgi:small neutral amino acid transporter SnatA (MarC family)